MFLHSKLTVDLVSIYFLLLGFFFINFSFLGNDTRRLISFSLFFIAIIFSLRNNINYLIRAKLSINHFIGLSIILYAIFFTYLYGTHGEYGRNKYYYFLLIIALSFIFIPPLFTNNKNIKEFVALLVLISTVYCFIAIFFSSADGARRGESGLNPALLARICMITGIYGLTLIYTKGANLFSVSLIIISCVAVLITGTKTPVPVAILSYFLITTEKLNTALFFKIVTSITIVLVISYFSLLYIIPESISNRILNLDALSVASQSTEGNRLELYNLAIQVILENYGGTGFGGFSSVHRFIVVPHNIFLENAVEMGVLSAAAFVSWSLYIMMLSKRNKTRNIHLLFIKILFIYMLISLMFGGETTIQSFLLYLSGSMIILNHKNG